MTGVTARSRAEAPNERQVDLRLPQYFGYGAGDVENSHANDDLAAVYDLKPRTRAERQIV